MTYCRLLVTFKAATIRGNTQLFQYGSKMWAGLAYANGGQTRNLHNAKKYCTGLYYVSLSMLGSKSAFRYSSIL